MGPESCGQEEAAISDSSQSKGPATVETLELLEAVSELVGRTGDYQEALEGSFRLLAHRLDCEVCSLYSYDPSSETLTLAATEGLPTRSIGRVILGKGEGLVGLVVEEGAPVSVEDALSHERFKFFPELGEEKYRAFLGSPVGEGQGIVGVLVLQARRRR